MPHLNSVLHLHFWHAASMNLLSCRWCMCFSQVGWNNDHEYKKFVTKSFEAWSNSIGSTQMGVLVEQ
ncbi:hypothetical protein DsansV1_C22g0170381 [Dioscorea sansibarensis]